MNKGKAVTQMPVLRAREIGAHFYNFSYCNMANLKRNIKD